MSSPYSLDEWLLGSCCIMRTKQVVVNHPILWGCCLTGFSKVKLLNCTLPSLRKQSQKEQALRGQANEDVVGSRRHVAARGPRARTRGLWSAGVHHPEAHEAQKPATSRSEKAAEQHSRGSRGRGRGVRRGPEQVALTDTPRAPSAVRDPTVVRGSMKNKTQRRPVPCR